MSSSSSSPSQKQLPLGREHVECDTCSKPGPPMRCSRCQSVFYCNQACQRAHWKNGHKHHCSTRTVPRPNHQVSQHATPSESSNSSCYICLSESMKDPFTFPDCGHTYCFGCLQKWQSKSQSCPACRREGTNVVDFSITIAYQHLFRAEANKNLSEKEQLKHCQRGLEELEKINLNGIEDPRNKPTILFLKGKALLMVKRPKEALETYKKIHDLVYEGAVVHNAMVRLAIEQNNFEHVLEMGGQVEFKNESSDKPRLGKLIYELYLLMAKCKEAMEDYMGAINVYAYSLAPAMESFDYPVHEAHINYEIGTARCMYHMKVYDMAIEAGERAIKLDRCFPQVHKYVALSQQASGNLSAAIRTMGRAVNYETNFDNSNRAINIKFYKKLMASAPAASASP